MIRLAIIIALFASVASAQTPNTYICHPHDQVAALLSSRYGESLSSIGLHRNGILLYEVWSNPETGTWTALLTRPDKCSFTVASGTDWRRFDQPMDDGGEDG